jgi:L-fuculose-phosphate aldolase
MTLNSTSSQPLAALINATVRKVLAEHLVSPAADKEPAPLSVYDLFHTEAVEELKAQILAAGQKLWQRQYVDGNGGNISVRINDELILCTPTLCSKGDLRAEDLSVVDLQNRHMFGARPHTSEILLHLEIYKAVPEAKAVIHCHPPYATAHAVAGVIPQGNLIPEQEVFIGPVALAPYDTPGTQAFAETVLPFVRKHNTILLANHGIVCWADTVSHAEWFVEIIETYCKTSMIASQLRSPLPQIPSEKIQDILAIKKRLGLPDARFPDGDLDQEAATVAKQPAPEPESISRDFDMDELAEVITAQILKALEERA